MIDNNIRLSKIRCVGGDEFFHACILLKKKCVPCEGGMEPLKQEEVFRLMEQLEGWNVADDFKLIFKEFKFKDFIGAINFVERVADVAEMEGHHPDIHIFYNKVVLEL